MPNSAITPDHLDTEGDAEVGDAAIEALAWLLVDFVLSDESAAEAA